MSPLDVTFQTVAPKSLRDRVIELSYKPITAGHPDKSRLFQTMEAQFYWPFMASKIIEHVKNCSTCVKEKGLRFK